MHIGELKRGAVDDCLSAILGSCIAVVLLDHDRGAFTLSHSLLPRATLPEHSYQARWVDQAILVALQRLRPRSRDYCSLQAVIVGGAQMSESAKAPVFAVGKLNTETAVELLGAQGVPIIAQEVGGNNGRRIQVCGRSMSCEINLIPRSVWT